MRQKKIINECSNHESSKDSEDSFFIFSSQVESKQQSKNELELITYFNDNNKSLHCLNNYPSIKTLFIKYNTSLYVHLLLFNVYFHLLVLCTLPVYQFSLKVIKIL